MSLTDPNVKLTSTETVIAPGLKIFQRRWGPLKSVSNEVIFFCLPGVGVTNVVFANFGNYMAKFGYQTQALDFRGFGRSSGKRGHIDSFEYYYQDINFLLQKLHEENRDRRIILIGPCLGGAMAFNFLERFPTTPLSALVIFSPLAAPIWGKPNLLMLSLFNILKLLAPELRVSIGGKRGAFWREGHTVEEIIHDSFNVHKISLRYLDEMQKCISNMNTMTICLKQPMLFFQSEIDMVTDKQVNIEIFAKIQSPFKEYCELKDTYHDALNDATRENSFELLHKWLQNNLIKQMDGV
ncbi:MAG: alpha/beta fold hydrolase [Bdellovibrio sp.]|nr:alpha/beta fold hydrolase [Bdellovibrio sp.]